MTEAAPTPAAPKEKYGQAVDRVREIVKDAAERDIESWGDLEAFLVALDERLDDDEACADLEHRPLREVERLCADLEFFPDWTKWTGTGWTPRTPYYRPPRPPNAGWSEGRRPSGHALGSLPRPCASCDLQGQLVAK